jgi:glycosyltransferase involved in cell wall biosynthesis
VKLLVITPKVDPADDLLGFAHTWMSCLAERVERLYVLQLWSAASSLPSNTRVHSMGKEGGANKSVQLANFVRLVGNLCLRRRVDAVLAHMGPIFAVCAAPFTRAAGIPLALWYAHSAVSPMLRLAHFLVDRVGTSSPHGFRLRSSKMRCTGQGIETDRFLPPAFEPDNGALVSAGRLSPVKDYETLLRALKKLDGLSVRPGLEIVGSPRSPSDARYLQHLHALTASLDLTHEVKFVPGIPHHAMASVYQRSSLFISASRTGSLDKAVLEALSCARPALTCNEAFADFHGKERDDYVFAAGDGDALAELLQRTLRIDPAERRRRGLALRERVVAEHSVDHLADELIALLNPASRHR